MSAALSTMLRRTVSDRARGVCEYCLIHEDDGHFPLQFDHIISRKHRGLTASSNLALACLRCHVAKGTDISVPTGSPPRPVRLFHPRRDSWRQHFKLSAARILPCTDTGTATVQLLDLNAPDRLLLRRTLIKAGRYPSLAALERMRD